MVLDSSALVAVLFGEPDARKYIEALATVERKLISSVTKFETALVVEARKGEAGSVAFSKLLVGLSVDVIAFDSSMAEVAMDAWRRYGKGRHPAGLNFGDCATYALARIANEPVLFKGEDFPKTDLVPVLAPELHRRMPES